MKGDGVMPADLHIHTSYSDGSDTPAQVVEKALALGLRALAITDHDTVAGVGPARAAASGRSLAVIPGVEINTDAGGRQVHILGYFIDIAHPELTGRLASLAEAGEARVKKIVAWLRRLDIPIRYEDVRARDSGTIGRAHVAMALCRLGTVASIQEAFDRFLGRGGPAYVRRTGCTPEEAVATVLAAGGVPVLAHPGIAGAGEMIPALVRAGLKGLEVHHPAHAPEQVRHYLELSETYGLVPTGGSDYHGRGYHSELGQFTVPLRTVAELEARKG